jgi:hypothetical protein
MISSKGITMNCPGWKLALAASVLYFTTNLFLL